MKHSVADPSPCERCGHRRDLHEEFVGVHCCRACDYAAVNGPCSTKRLREDALLEALSFKLD